MSPFLRASTPDEMPARIGKAEKDRDGFLTHPVESALQKGPTLIQVLRPDRLEPGKRYPVVYVLPVEAGTQSRYGNGLREIKKLDLHNQHSLIFVQPTFASLPWYVDHPTDGRLQQESYFLKVVLPFVEKEYPAVAERRGRLLLGFSKSGWGAFSLLLRHPDHFGKAAAWDAPMTMERPQFGMAEIVGTQENFERYRITRLLEQKGAAVRQGNRLALVGHANFRTHHQALHERLDRLKITHEYRDVARSRHTWDAGWLEDAVRFLTSKPPG